MPELSFLWPLLPPFLDKASIIAAIATVAKGPCRALHDMSRLRVGHVHLHPNSLGSLESHRDRGFRNLPTSSCLTRISLVNLISVQFHLPCLTSALWLLEGLATSRCYSLRKIVDRQSRWRPRQQQLENLDVRVRMNVADLSDELGHSLLSLRHLEGPVFSTVLRARSSSAPVVNPDNSSVTSCNDSDRTKRQSYFSLGSRVEVLHLSDVCVSDLLGLWEPSYSCLQKLILLQLPASAPGRTVETLADFLPKAPNLNELQLDFQYFNPQHWDLKSLELLMARIQLPPSKVEKLNLEWCRLGDAGVRSICHTLSEYTRAPDAPSGGVTDLSLAHCDLKDISSVCRMLRTPGLTLTKLDLSSNDLSDSQADQLAMALLVSKVKDLRLRDSQISTPLPVKTEWFWGC